MCEFNIKRDNNYNADPDKDRRGCYKRGDIINVQPDGEYTDKTNHTVLAVPGLSHVKVRKLMEERRELESKQVSITEAEYQVIKDLQQTITYNDKEYTIYMGKYVNPQLVSNVDGIRTYNVQELENYQRRRFRIPENLMNQLFPDGVYRREISKATFLNHLDKVYDKTFDLNIEDTTWKQTLIDDINDSG